MLKSGRGSTLFGASLVLSLSVMVLWGAQLSADPPPACQDCDWQNDETQAWCRGGAEAQCGSQGNQPCRWERTQKHYWCNQIDHYSCYQWQNSWEVCPVPAPPPDCQTPNCI
jgi:hypothetical protein